MASNWVTIHILGFKVFLQILEQEKSACKVYNRRSMLLPKVVAFKFLNNLDISWKDLNRSKLIVHLRPFAMLASPLY